jgi:hypothetical protein
MRCARERARWVHVAPRRMMRSMKWPLPPTTISACKERRGSRRGDCALQYHYVQPTAGVFLRGSRVTRCAAVYLARGGVTCVQPLCEEGAPASYRGRSRISQRKVRSGDAWWVPLTLDGSMARPATPRRWRVRKATLSASPLAGSQHGTRPPIPRAASSCTATAIRDVRARPMPTVPRWL